MIIFIHIIIGIALVACLEDTDTGDNTAIEGDFPDADNHVEEKKDDVTGSWYIAGSIRYFFSTYAVTWGQSQAVCQQNGARLADFNYGEPTASALIDLRIRNGKMISSFINQHYSALVDQN